MSLIVLPHYLVGLVVYQRVVTVAAVARRALPAGAHVARRSRLRRHVALVVVRSRDGPCNVGQVPLGVDLPVDVPVGADGAEDDLLLGQHRVVVLTAAVVVAALADLLLAPQCVGQLHQLRAHVNRVSEVPVKGLFTLIIFVMMNEFIML